MTEEWRKARERDEAYIAYRRNRYGKCLLGFLVVFPLSLFVVCAATFFAFKYPFDIDNYVCIVLGLVIVVVSPFGFLNDSRLIYDYGVIDDRRFEER